MSLDVYLTTPGVFHKRTSAAIFVREGGQTKEISREVYEAMFPGRWPVSIEKEPETEVVYTDNITHNLAKMADEAGLYIPLWRPETAELLLAKDLIEPLWKGVRQLRSEPDKYRQFNPDNGWGSYELLVGFTDKYLAACINNPDAIVSVSR